MINHKDLRPSDLNRPDEQLVQVEELMPLPRPYDKPGMEPDFMEVKPVV